MKTVIEMAIEAELIGSEAGMCCWIEGTNLKPYIERLVDIARADEREQCATLCENLVMHPEQGDCWDIGTLDCAQAIRARSNT